MGRMAFTGRWRRYQEQALNAFEADRAAGRWQTHIVAPPGSGKTLVGIEMVRRLGRPAVVFAPNSAVQAQWPRAVAAFSEDADLVGFEPGRPITALTYQAICQLDDPVRVLGDAAERRWTRERAAATGATPEQVEIDVRNWTGQAAARRRRELAQIGNSLKREIARAEHGDLHLGELLRDGARSRLDALAAAGVGTIVLDECHHLASLWGYAIRVAIEELGREVHVIGLTATPPGSLTRDELRLYDALLGPVDFTVPTPAVVRDGHLAPYQELAWLTEPLESEDRWLTEHDARFRELVTALHADPDGPLSFPAWVIARMRGREMAAPEHPDGHEAVDNWAAFARRSPRLARAGMRFLSSAGLALPTGATAGEAYRQPPSMDDWLVLLEDYALRCLRPDPTAQAAERHAAVAAALRDLGYNLTRQGIRRGASDVDRLLATSASKPLALVEIIAAEAHTRGTDLRGLVLCDAEQRAGREADALVGVLDAAAGTAAEALRSVASDPRTSHLRPILVSGRGLRCAPDDGAYISEQLRIQAGRRDDIAGWRIEPDHDGLVAIRARGAGWTSRTWVQLATALLTEGTCQLMVGTRALLGEGWDAPCVNCLVDMTTATTRVSVTQMRGRSLRLDPAAPAKLASNWDIICIAPGHARGEADYERFVRKHDHLYAPAEDGVIEAGPSHVHPALGPFSPPPAAEVGQINRQMATRAGDHARARLLWAIGTPYHGVEQATLVVRPGGTKGGPGPSAPPQIDPQPLPRGRLALAWQLGALRGELNGTMPLERAALVVRDALVACGDLRPRAAERLSIEPRASGYLRVALPDADPDESARFTQALEQMLVPNPAARYVIGRHVPGRQGRLGAVARCLIGRPPHPVRWAALPDDFGRHRSRADHFADAWRRWFGAGELRFTQREELGRRALAEAAASADPRIAVAARTTWS